MDKKVSIIIRTIDNRYEFLEKTLFSVFCSDYDQKEIIIVYQGKSSKYFEKIKQIKNYYPEMEFVFIQNPTSADERSKNLNLGLEAASGRFIAFLDDDDYVTQNHYSSLIEKIIEKDKAWGYSENIECYYENSTYLSHTSRLYWKGKFNFQKLLKGNYIPICAWVIDTHKIEKKNLLFDENLTRLEDYVFLLNLALKYEPAQTNKITSIYNLYLNSKTQSNAQKSKEEKFEWKKAKDKLSDIKKKIYNENYLIIPAPEEKKYFRLKGNLLGNIKFKLIVYKKSK